MKFIRTAAVALLAFTALSQAQTPLKVLFWGGPGGGAHNPTPLRDTLAQFFGSGVQMQYRSTNVPVWLHPDTLAQFDVMLVYTTNQTGNDLSATQLTHLYDWVDSGHVVVALHGATNTFLNGTNAFRGTTTTAGWRQLLGAQFVDHASGNNSGTITFRTPRHPSLDSATPLPTSAGATGGLPFWDEGRRHNQYVSDTVVIARARLNNAGDTAVPWIWVRPQGKGWIYYNASGHDAQVWKQAEFKGQILRALQWGAKVGKPTGLRGKAASKALIKIQGNRILIPGIGHHSLRIHDMAGKSVLVRKNSPADRHDLSGLPLGIYAIEVLTRADAFRGTFVRKP
jgi:type 1 glutamine amidotransferase